MGYFRQVVIIFLITVFSGCGVSKRVGELQGDAREAFESDKFSEALEYFEELIDLQSARRGDTDGFIWYGAGISAWETGQALRAIEYLDQAARRSYVTERSLYVHALAFREIDNLSREINKLETYAGEYPDGDHMDEVQKRLFATYLESNNHDLARELWPFLESRSEDDSELLEGYFILNRDMGNDERLAGIARKIEKLDRDNITALEYLGDHYFWKAENSYQEEMAAYENNRTTRQYRQLLGALDEINEQFRISRDYFEKLWELKQDPRYAAFLRNIYLRFGNEGRAEYFNKRSENR